MEHFLETVLDSIAPVIIMALEIIGIFIILYGSLAALYNFVKNKLDLRENRTKIILGEALSLGLEFKLGSEIIKTVIVRSLDELIILGIIVGLRVVLTLLIHWEVEQADLSDEFRINKEKEEAKKLIAEKKEA
ncbi:DUF1622 domain-containing protein [Helcococcus kunzii]|uniref:DUF1622 domain-containing protein n=1 Tax=Helcococcus kunzii TaxID=40091 RepID=UPI0024AD53CA|nr:DUF1622 domain-containing protein [Helcococcus kunzii]